MSGLTYDICLVYLDDILVFSKTFEEHCDRLSTIFDRMERYMLKMKPTRCHLFQRKVKFLGHVVSGKGIECDPDKVAAIATWPTLTNISEVRTFCRLASYYRGDLCPRLRETSQTTAQINSENATFVWNQECEAAFQALKERLMSAPILVPPRDEGKYFLDTDASDTVLGTVLQQEQDGQLRVIGYASCALMNAKRRYCITRKELLGVVYGLKKYRQHLLGRKIVVRTDHVAITFLKKCHSQLVSKVDGLTSCRNTKLKFSTDQATCIAIAMDYLDDLANAAEARTANNAYELSQDLGWPKPVVWGCR